MIKNITEIPLDGGSACLDFINSGYNDELDVITERWLSYKDLLVLVKRLKLMPIKKIQRLEKLSIEKPRLAVNALRKAIEIRSHMHTIFIHLANSRMIKIGGTALKSFNNEMFNALSKQTLIADNNLLLPGWNNDVDDLDDPLFYFLKSAHDILVHKNQKRIKQCGGCAWLFLDETKNNTRKWCKMQSCGCRQKAKRYYRRKLAGKTQLQPKAKKKI